MRKSDFAHFLVFIEIIIVKFGEFSLRKSWNTNCFFFFLFLIIFFVEYFYKFEVCET